jgi:type I restriction enzyme S subunit
VLRVTDGTHQAPQTQQSGIPFIVIGDVGAESIRWDRVAKFVSDDVYAALTKSLRPQRGDVLYTAVGSFGRAIEVTWAQPFVFQRHIAVIRPDPSRLLSRFLAQVLNSPEVFAQADRVARGVAQRTITLGLIAELQIPLPPLDEQRAIVTRIDAAFTRARAMLSAADAARAQLDVLERSVLAKAFRGELVEQDPADEPASVMLDRVRAERAKSGAPAKKPRKPRASA